jgi:hypothetical protein
MFGFNSVLTITNSLVRFIQMFIIYMHVAIPGRLSGLTMHLDGIESPGGCSLGPPPLAW